MIKIFLRGTVLVLTFLHSFFFFFRHGCHCLQWHAFISPQHCHCLFLPVVMVNYSIGAPVMMAMFHSQHMSLAQKMLRLDWTNSVELLWN